jgi:sodium/proline symporter
MQNALKELALWLIAGALLWPAWRARRWLHVGEDFALARGRLPALFAGLGQACACVPPWFLLALAWHAYVWGAASVWLLLASVSGLVCNWWLVAPRLRKLAGGQGFCTAAQWLAMEAGDRLRNVTLRTAGFMVLTLLTLATAVALQWAMQLWSQLSGISPVTALVLLTLYLCILVALSGLWSASYADVLQAGVLMGGSVALALATLVAVRGAAGPPIGTQAVQWFAGYSGVLALAFVVGVFFAVLGGVAQPAALADYLASKPGYIAARARRIALAWALVVLVAAYMLGMWARTALDSGSEQGGALLTSLWRTVLPDVPQELGITLLIVVLVTSVARSWVAAAAHVATDPLLMTMRAGRIRLSLAGCRMALLAVALAAALLVFYFPARDFSAAQDRLWYCWQSLGAAFAPLLLVRLSGKKVRPGSALGAMWSGFLLSAVLHQMPDTPGDLLERCLPFVAAMGVALSGGERRRNPDRADRGDKTVHDHLPI